MFNLSILSILSIPSILLSLSLFWVQRTKENGKKKERKSQGHTSAKFQLQEFRKNFKKMMFPINPLEEALNIGFCQSPSMKTETKKFENIASTSGSHQSHTSAKFQLQEFRKNFKKMMFSINPLEEAALLNIGFLGETHLNFWRTQWNYFQPVFKWKWNGSHQSQS